MVSLRGTGIKTSGAKRSTGRLSVKQDGSMKKRHSYVVSLNSRNMFSLISKSVSNDTYLSQMKLPKGLFRRFFSTSVIYVYSRQNDDLLIQRMTSQRQREWPDNLLQESTHSCNCNCSTQKQPKSNPFGGAFSDLWRDKWNLTSTSTASANLA